MYKIKDAGIKGFGVFAVASISRGTRILAERALFSVKTEGSVYAASQKLDDEDQVWFKQLSIANNKALSIAGYLSASLNLIQTRTLPTSSAIGEYNTVLAAFRNNNFNIGNGRQALFRDICRINHSCVPNSQGNFNSAIGCFTIHAVRPIETGEEITISYLQEHGAPRDSRQRQLSHGYGFTCNCPVCNGSTAVGQSSEERRVQMRKRLREHAENASLHENPDNEDETKVLLALIQMFEEEGLRGRELSTMYLTAAETKLKYGDRREAQRFAKVGLQIEEDCLGSDNPFFVESVKRMRPIIGL